MIRQKLTLHNFLIDILFNELILEALAKGYFIIAYIDQLIIKRRNSQRIHYIGFANSRKYGGWQLAGYRFYIH